VTGSPDLPAPDTDAEPETQPFTDFIWNVLDEKRATDVVWLDVRGLTDLADDFFIATIQNPRQGAAIVDACEREAKRRGVKRLGVEGEAGASWILLDYGDVIIHLFHADQRAYYALENIWGDAPRVR